MGLDVAAVQDALRKANLDGWLLYDFHGSNPIAAGLAGLVGGAHMTTRRWYYLIPAQGRPRGLVHAIERHNLDQLPGDKTVYAGRQQLDTGLTQLLTGMRRMAMEYSPMCAIPYLSRVDAGTAEAIRAKGVEILSSGDLVQQFEAAWTPAQLASHQTASAALYRIKDRAFEMAAAAVRARRAVSEYESAAADGAVVRGRGADQRFGAGRRGRGQRGQSALSADGGAVASHLGRRGAAAGSLGQDA